MTRTTKLLLAVLTPLLVAAGLYATTVPASATSYGGNDWKTISAGDSKTCGIRTTGQLFCWNTDGTGSSSSSISNYSDWKSVSVGRSHQCAIRGTGVLYCWGDDTKGQLGNGDAGSKTYPYRVASTATNWTSVSAGGTHTCGILGTGYLYCWGDDDQGQLGNGDAGSKVAPYRVAGTATNWKSVSAGGTHTCGILGTGYLYCWGDDTSGQLGNGSSVGNKTSPYRAASSATNWRSVSAGDTHTCGIAGSGLAACWGSDSQGQLGNGSDGSRQSPSAINSGFQDWKSARAGGSHTCGIRGAGYLYCWGDDTYHQVGGSTNPVQSPHWYGTSHDWTVTDTGAKFSCGIRGAGYLYCWGAQKVPCAGTAYPAGLPCVGYLKAWKVTLPVDGADSGPYADEVEQPQLATYSNPSYFHTNSTNTAIVLRAPVGGAKTSGSTYARTELRNMYPYTGGDAQTYNWTSGTHVLEVNEAFTHLPPNKPDVVGVQIHDPYHQVLMIRLIGQHLYAQQYIPSTKQEVNVVLDSAYKLGTQFNVKVTADSNGIHVDYNGVRKADWNRHATSTSYWYFKAGCYLHSNTTYDAASEYGEVLIYSLKVTHNGVAS